MATLASLHQRLLNLLTMPRRNDERGAALVEYALLLVLIAVFCMVALTFLGNTAANKFSVVGNSVAAA